MEKLSKEHQLIMDFIKEDLYPKWPDFEPRDNLKITQKDARIWFRKTYTNSTNEDQELQENLESLLNYVRRPSTTLQDIERELKQLRDLRMRRTKR